MTLKTFAQFHRYRIRRDECNELYIPGRYGQIFDYGNGRLGVLCMFGNFKSAKKWNNARRILQSHGFTIMQNGDREGSAIFDPRSPSQSKVACRIIGVKKRRVPTEAQLKHLGEIRRMAQTPTRKAHAAQG